MYGNNIVVDTDLFEGMYPLLEELEAQQIPWGIVTNKPRGLSESLLEKLNLTERCAVLVCPEDVSKTKPDPEPMYLAAKQLNIPANEIIYVGITHVISMQYRNADMYTILAAYGYLPIEHRDDLNAWQADSIVNTVTELHELLRQKLPALQENQRMIS